MSSKPAVQTAEGWDATASDYDQFVTSARMTGQFARDAIALALESPLADNTTITFKKDPEGKPFKALDVAAGTGAATLELVTLWREAGHKEGLEITSTDFAPAMVKQLQVNVNAATVPGGPVIQCSTMDGQDLKFGDNTFDLGTIIFGLMFYPDPLQGLKEMLRVLKPNGVAAVATWSADGGINKLIREAMLSVMDQSSNKPKGLSLSDAEDLKNLAIEAGFREAHVHCITHDMVWKKYGDFNEGFKTNPGMKHVLSTVKPELRDAFEEAVQKKLKEYPEPVHVPAPALILIAKK